MRAQRLAALICLVLLSTLATPVAAQQPPGGVAADRYIVVFGPGVDNPRAAASDLAGQHGFSVERVYEHAIRGFAAAIPAGRVAALSRDPRVAYVEADQLVLLDEQTVPTGVRRIFAGGNGTDAGDNANLDIDGTDDERVDVDVAIIDTGIDLTHADLNVVASTNCTGGSPLVGSCGNGGDDDNGHGTHVAGTVAAIDNGVGVVGVAPGARLHAVKVLRSDGSGYMSWIVAGIDWVTARASTIEVANMSLGCECTSAALDAAISRSVAEGVTYAVAAGNSGANAATHSPANHPDVITVSALADFDGVPGGTGAATCRADGDDTLANFSNFGATVEIAAPGVCILSTWFDGGYNTISGTSMASPHVAGAGAVLAASGPYSPADIRRLLLAEGNFGWTDDSGDGIQEPLLDVSDELVFNPATVAGGGGGGGATTMHVGDLDGAKSSQSRNAWKATVTVSVHDSAEVLVSNATVSGSWSNGGTASCVTGTSGSCSVTKSKISNATASVTFTVTGVSHGSLAYVAGSNHDTDADSTGTAITVTKP